MQPLQSFLILGLISVSLFTETLAYIPAIAANASDSTNNFNISDNSTVQLTWYPNGTFETVVSYQASGRNSSGISKGALVGFNEDALVSQNSSTTVPWIAWINCDANSTNMSVNTDIFTLAYERGAVASLLYSNYSNGCALNNEFSQNYLHVMDIFTVKRASTGSLIESQFQNVLNSSYTTFDPTFLNDSKDAISASLPSSAINTSPYIIATLRAANATGEESSNNHSDVPTPSTHGNLAFSQTSGSILGTSLVLFVIGITLLTN